LDWDWIARPVDGVAVTAADVIILRKEFERCESAGVFDASAVNCGTRASNPTKRQAEPGTPPKHAWDAFAGAIAWRVHDHGMPVSHCELVRNMMDWFSGREDFPPPDERTVRRKVSAIWREFVSASPWMTKRIGLTMVSNEADSESIPACSEKKSDKF
jgi:hypothetical protein